MKGQNRKKNIILVFIFCVGYSIFSPPLLKGSSPLQVDVWLDRGDGGVYHSSDPMTVYFKVDRSSYVTVYNIDTDGYVNILYPYYPGMDNYVAGGKTYSVPGGGYELALYIDEPVGMGYIEAVASDDPFYLDEWPFLSQSYESVEGAEVIRRITGDPFLSIDEINRKILPFAEELVYSDDFAMYYVEEVVHYPRYLCSDCHVPSYYHYEPYYYSCPSYYIVVYDYWYYNDYCYWDFYYPYDYYEYYYRFPRSSGVGRRYSRKYDYRTRDDGVYRTKGESTLSAGVIRVRDYEGGEAQYSNPVTVGETEDVGRSSAVFRERTTVDDLTGNLSPRASHSSIREDAGYGSRGETVFRKAEVEGSDGRESGKTATRVTVAEQGNSSGSLRRAESRRVDEGDAGDRSVARTRSARTLGDDDSGAGGPAFQRHKRVSGRENRGRTRSSKQAVRVEEGRARTSHGRIGRQEGRTAIGRSGKEVARGRGFGQANPVGGRGAEVRRSPARTGPQRSFGRGGAMRRPSFSR